jgi:hypothetical protein
MMVFLLAMQLFLMVLVLKMDYGSMLLMVINMIKDTRANVNIYFIALLREGGGSFFI